MEVKRLTRFEKHSHAHVNIDTVLVTFQGTVLPSHVIFDKLVIPVVEHKVPILQCSKCWCFGHSTRSCRSKFPRCVECGLRENRHGEYCENTICVNCLGPHNSCYEFCPKLLDLKNQQRSKILVPEINDLDEFPPLPRSNARVAKNKPLKQNSIPSKSCETLATTTIENSNSNLPNLSCSELYLSRKRRYTNSAQLLSTADINSVAPAFTFTCVTKSIEEKVISKISDLLCDRLSSNKKWFNDLNYSLNKSSDDSDIELTSLSSDIIFKSIITNEIEKILSINSLTQTNPCNSSPSLSDTKNYSNQDSEIDYESTANNEDKQH